ncbi:MAG: hypothetical protein H7238_14015 [Polaromonas sp.]|nr:hypothetical protein [Polaromonas sp.]
MKIFGLALLWLFALPALAAEYSFPGNLPVGCVDNSGGSYSCNSLALAAGDRISIGTQQPVTIIFAGALSAGANVLINSGSGSSNLHLLINGALTLGADSVLNATVQTFGAGAVTLGANSSAVGSISTETGFVAVGAATRMGGTISTRTGYVSLGAGAAVEGGVSTVTGYISLGDSAFIDGPVTTEKEGYVALGASARIKGDIAVQGDGYVTMGDSAVAGGNISTVHDAITLGANSQVAGSVAVSQTGAVTVGAGAVVGGNITTQVGDVTVGANAMVGGTIGGVIAINGSGDITIGAGGRINAVCCKGVDTSCVPNYSAIQPPPQVCPAAVPANFECLQAGAGYNNVLASPGLRNPLYTKLAGTAFILDLVALRADGTMATSYAGAASRNVRLEFVSGEGAMACASRAALAPDAGQTVTFGVGSGGRKTATVTLNQSHANLRCRVTDANQSPSVVGCSTDNFAVRPSAVVLQASATAAAPSAASLPAIAASANFTLRALTLAGSNYSGQLRLDTDKLTAQLPGQDATVQAGGTVGLLQPSALPANASVLALANYSEVGYLYLAPGAYRDDAFTAVDSAQGDCITQTANNAYLADTLVDGKYGCSVGNPSALAWGRFYPDRLSLSPSALTAACTAAVPYTYFSEDGLTTWFWLTAQNAAGGTTKNYSGAFAKFKLENYLSYGFSAAPLPAGSVLASSSTTTPGGEWLDGTARAMAKHQISRPAAPTAQTLITVSAAPSDGEIRASAAVPVGAATPLRYGRLQLKNAYGSELLALPVPLEAQYWTAAGYYTTNIDDSCTVLSPRSVVMGGYTKQLKACDTQLSPARAVTLLAGKLPGAGLVLTKPGAANAGSVDLSINLGDVARDKTCLSADESLASAARQPWFGPDPSARATFGIYKSTKIYTRENY